MSAFVQAKGFGTSGSASTSVGQLLDGAVGAGNALTVWVAIFNLPSNDETFTVTDDRGGSYAPIGTRNEAAVNGRFEGFQALNHPGGATTVTVTSNFSGHISASAIESSGVLTSGAVAASNYGGSDAGGTTGASGSVSPGGASFVCSGVFTIDGARDPAPPAGWTEPAGAEFDNPDSETVSSAYRVEPSGGTFSCDWTWTTASDFYAGIVALTDANIVPWVGRGTGFQTTRRPRPFAPGLAR